MKFTPEVLAAFQILKNAAENDSEKVAVANFENELKKFSKEIWRDVVGYEGLYQVSNAGRVKSFHGKSERILVGGVCREGYVKVLLRKNKSRKLVSVHRLVAMAFIPNPDNKPEVNHINGNKIDNRVENLEWKTRAENAKHAYDIGLEKPLHGINANGAKFTAEQIAEIRATYIRGDEKLGVQALAQKFNVCKNTISKIINFETYNDSM